MSDAEILDYVVATARLVGQTGGAVLIAMIFRLAGPATTVPLFLSAALAMTAALLSVGRLRIAPAQT